MDNNTIILIGPKKGQKYYAVHCKCGHVGKNCYVEIVFAVKANNGKEAASKARRIARVKHNKKSAIIHCYEISKEQYYEIIKANKEDPYLKCRNIQEQRLIDGFESRIIKEPKLLLLRRSKKERNEFVKYKLKKQKQLIEDMENSIIYGFVLKKGTQHYENIY